MHEFLLELGAWSGNDTITEWLQGPGRVTFDEFGIDLFPPNERQAYRQSKMKIRTQVESDEHRRRREEWDRAYNLQAMRYVTTADAS